MIDVTHLSFSFGNHLVLQDVSFTLGQGEFAFLMGPSGSGKTTLLRILHGALPLTRGKATVAGFELRKITSWNRHLLRRMVSVVFQDFKVLPHRTVFDNVALPLFVRGTAKDIIHKRVAVVLRSLHLEDKVQVRCEELSGGEQQRVAVARAIVVKPKVLLADEPTGNLDRTLALRMMDVFRQFNRFGTTVLLATHNPEMVARVPEARVLNIQEGRIV
ncbi:MAG: cell division transport system ATP-binding protein [Desulfomicrobiaceae bacterium]|jgi:cell division transport system ATP-binding protein|nr:cell division transport system ATP-binding protein [Desulfomicrobiaceae bacterium]MDK2873002.1 cell division transport system ATP-binding protein [Desulfomicrobiaceae bacterium]HCF05152.1 cell division ATP-binding protein FtsE [Desulfomicrobiaceae bacterium]